MFASSAARTTGPQLTDFRAWTQGSLSSCRAIRFLFISGGRATEGGRCLQQQQAHGWAGNRRRPMDLARCSLSDSNGHQPLGAAHRARSAVLLPPAKAKPGGAPGEKSSATPMAAAASYSRPGRRLPLPEKPGWEQYRSSVGRRCSDRRQRQKRTARKCCYICILCICPLRKVVGVSPRGQA